MSLKVALLCVGMVVLAGVAIVQNIADWLKE